MSTDRTQRVLQLVDQALGIDPDERVAWLRQACEGDDGLLAEAMDLLALAPAAASFLPVDCDSKVTKLSLADPTPTCGPAAAEFTAGSELGDFLIEEQIGVGGMGVVYRARQVSLNRPVALKVLPASLRHSPSANTRFRREIEAAARLHHTNIVSVYSSGEQQGALYYAMELIAGPPLSRLLNYLRANPVPELIGTTPRAIANEYLPSATTPAWAINYLTGSADQPANQAPTQHSTAGFSDGDYFDRVAMALADAADALHYAHERQIIHRDIKPSNLLLSREGRLHISDFGLARIMHEPGLTRTGEMLGTPYYMAPEQIQADPAGVDGRVDIYALGATLYELLTLQPPFVGENRERVIHQILEHQPLAPRRINRRVPLDLQTICLKALQKHPADRYQNAAQMAADLRAFVQRFAIAARPVGVISRLGKWARRHPGLSSMLALACCLALVAIFFAQRARHTQSLWDEVQQHQIFEQALMAALEGKRANAEMALQQARKLGAPVGEINLLEGQIDYMATLYTNAQAHFELAVAELPENVAAQSLLALNCMRRLDFDRGEALYRQQAKLSPATLEDFLHRARVEAYFDPDKAARTLNLAVERERSSLVARLIRAEVQLGRAIDTANLEIAEQSLDDYRIARQLLGDTPIVTSGLLRAQVAGATACQVHQQDEQRQKLLTEAAELANQLSNSKAYRVQRALAQYYEYIGNVDLAIEQLRKFQHRQVLYLVLTLLREGRFTEVTKACQSVERSPEVDRMVAFFRALSRAMQTDSPAQVRSAFSFAGKVNLDPIHELLTVYTISCLVERPELRQQRCQRLLEIQRLPSFRHDWYGSLSAYACGEISAAELLSRASGSRKSLCEAHYYLGAAELAAGNRDAAKQHFMDSAATQVVGYFEYYLSRALLAQLEREPAWPTWISNR